jgi:ribosomal protein S18 acetylase RimI-like enzyme
VRTRDRLGTKTDDRLRPPGTLIDDHGDCRVIRTPSCPDYHFGNLISIEEPPAEAAPWLERCRREMADLAIQRLVLEWEQDVDAPVLAGAQRRMVLVRRGPGAPVPAPPGVVLRTLAPGEEDSWRQACAIRLDDGAEFGPGYERFLAWQQGTYRDADPRHFRNWGAFTGERLEASLVCYEDDEFVRVEDVLTRREARGRGIGPALIEAAYASARERRPRALSLIVADDGGAGDRLYRRLGFTPASAQLALVSAP